MFLLKIHNCFKNMEKGNASYNVRLKKVDEAKKYFLN